MGHLERFAGILGTVWSRLWNAFDCFLWLREGHLRPSWGIVRRCDLHMRNIDFTSNSKILRVTFGGFRPCVCYWYLGGIRRPEAILRWFTYMETP